MAGNTLFHEQDWMFSYRVGALIYHNGTLLMQHSTGAEGYALPGGEVAFGEFSDESLARELKEKLGIAVRVGRLCFVAEQFFEGEKPCQQINLFYLAELKNKEDLPQGTFHPLDDLGRERSELEFCWIPLELLNKTKIYPSCIRPYLKDLPPHTVHLCENKIK